MIEILAVKLTYEALGFLAAFIVSEVIGVSKLKENSIAQLVKNLIDTQRPHRKEDDKAHDVNKSRALFATHYHEMTALADKMDNVENATVTVKEWEGDVIFLHEVKKGAADRSYGVQVAKLAGLPSAVVERARVVLDALEQGEREGSTTPKSIIDDLPLFAATPTQTAPVASEANELEQMLNEILPDELTPRQALQKLYELKEALK